MHVQEQAFRAYYASMTDSDLLAVAANKTSFVDLAQRVLGEEMARRHLVPLSPAAPGKPAPAGGLLGRWFHLRSQVR